MALKNASVLPGFSLAMGITLVYLSLLVLIPLSMILLQTAGMGLSHFWSVVSSPRVAAAYRLSFGAAFIAAIADSAARRGHCHSVRAVAAVAPALHGTGCGKAGRRRRRDRAADRVGGGPQR